MIQDKFNHFLKTRQNLIFMYKKGDLSKSEYIEENYNLINSLGIKPFRKIDNVKKAIYNYQYYNVLAKYYRKLASQTPPHKVTHLEYAKKSDYFYDKKDKATESLLKLLDFKGVEAYFVKVSSPNLKKKLFEIVFTELDGIVLHSKNERILEMLRYEGVFKDDTVRKSVIDNYVNQKY